MHFYVAFCKCTLRSIFGSLTSGFPRWLCSKESVCQCRKQGFDPWVGEIPCRRKWQPTPVFLPGKFHEQRSLKGYSPWGHIGSDTESTRATKFNTVQFSCSVMSDSLQSHESQHTRPPCPSLTPGVHSNSLSIESVMPSSHLILCCPLLLLPPIPPSIRVFSN